MREIFSYLSWEARCQLWWVDGIHVKGLASCAKRELYLNVMIPAAAIKKN